MKRTLAAALMTAGLMAGCGMGGGMETMTGPTASVTGKVADGYLWKATVFLDKNGNYQLDPGEPSATTDENGAYALTVDPVDVGRYHIVALAVKGVTIDRDTDTAVANSYVMSLPRERVSGAVNSNFISPMTTQIREMMETGKYASVQEAMEALRTQMGMAPGTNVMADYMAANSATNTAMHAAARNMASLMSSQMSQVMPTAGTRPEAPAVDVDRYRGMMGTIFSNISAVKVPNAPMTGLMGTMSAAVSNMPMMTPGRPYRNMSAAFRGGMMGGRMGR